MSLVDYPLFSWVVVIHSLHVSSFQEAHHQEFIFLVQSASGIVYDLCCNPPADVHVFGLQLVLSTRFVIPDCCICFVEFSFDVPILIYFFGLFGVDKFCIHCSVHH